MIVDYFAVRYKTLFVEQLYQPNGMYSYTNGYNLRAIAAFIAGVLPNVAGFLVQIKALDPHTVPAWLTNLYHYAWFVGFGVSAVVYLLLMKNKPAK